MALYHNRDKLDMNTTIEDSKGRHLPATLVFGKCISYMKIHVLNHLNECGVPYIEEDTKWVVTVPAIWTERAKALMRKAATDVAGISSANLTLALEPECAAIYCSQLTRNQLEIKGVDNNVQYIAAQGSVIMVADIGGGTVDITTMRIRPDGTMDQVHMSGGGPHGGMTVDEKFFMMLNTIVGEKVWDAFLANHQVEYYDMRADFERSKSTVSKETKFFRLQISHTLITLWEKTEGKTLQNLLEGSKIKQIGIAFANSHLTFPVNYIWKWYDECAAELLNDINSILSHEGLQGVKISALVTVGGFSMSSYLIEALRQVLKEKGIPVVRPIDTEIAVMKGAVLFGHKEDIIHSRIMPRTYGVSCVMEFNERHRREHKFENGGKVWANNCFRKHVTRDQTVKLGELICVKEYYPDDEALNSATIYMFSSDKTDPTHTTDEGCVSTGKFDVQCHQAVEVTFLFGGTEMQVSATSNDGITSTQWLHY